MNFAGRHLGGLLVRFICLLFIVVVECGFGGQLGGFERGEIAQLHLHDVGHALQAADAAFARFAITGGAYVFAQVRDAQIAIGDVQINPIRPLIEQLNAKPVDRPVGRELDFEPLASRFNACYHGGFSLRGGDGD